MDPQLVAYSLATSYTSTLPCPETVTLQDTQLVHVFSPVEASEIEHAKWDSVKDFIRSSTNILIQPSYYHSPNELFLYSHIDLKIVQIPNHKIRAYIYEKDAFDKSISYPSEMITLFKLFPLLLFSGKEYAPVALTTYPRHFHSNINGPFVIEVITDDVLVGFRIKTYIWIEKLHQLLSNGELPCQLGVLAASEIKHRSITSKSIAKVITYDYTHIPSFTDAMSTKFSKLETDLMPHQIETLKWLLEMETKPVEKFIDVTAPLFHTFGDEKYKFWFDSFHGPHVGIPPYFKVTFPPGGYLNNGYGSGKTLTLLALILLTWDEKIVQRSPFHHSGTLIICHSNLITHWLIEIKKHTSILDEDNGDVLILWNTDHLHMYLYDKIRKAKIVIAAIEIFDDVRYDPYVQQLMESRPLPLLQTQYGIHPVHFRWHRVILDECWRNCQQSDIQLYVKADIRWIVSGSSVLGRAHCGNCNTLPLFYFSNITGLKLYIELTDKSQRKLIHGLRELTHGYNKSIIRVHNAVFSTYGSFLQEALFHSLEYYMATRRFRIPCFDVDNPFVCTVDHINITTTPEEMWIFNPKVPKADQQQRFITYHKLGCTDVKHKDYIIQHAGCIQTHSTSVPCNGSSSIDNNVTELIKSSIKDFIPVDDSLDPSYPSCFICFEVIKPPKVPVCGLLPCSHIICRHCILEIFTHGRNEVTDSFKCPVCRLEMDPSNCLPIFFFSGSEECLVTLDTARYGGLFVWLVNTLLTIGTQQNSRVFVYGFNAVVVQHAKRLVSKKFPMLFKGCTVEKFDMQISPKNFGVLASFSSFDTKVDRMQVIFMGDMDGTVQSSNFPKLDGFSFPLMTHAIIYDKPNHGYADRVSQNIKILADRIDRPKNLPLHILIPNLTSY